MLTDICRSQLNNRNNDFPFFNPSTKSYDCNVAMCSEAVQLVTGKKLTALQVREQGGDLVGGTGTRMARRVFQKNGMVAGTNFITLNGVPTSDWKDLLFGGWFVVIYIKYDIMRQVAPDIVGDGAYNKAHAIATGDWWRAGGIRKTHYYDPLNDGRLSASLGGRAPKGPQTADFRDVRDAAWAYSEAYELADTGRGTGFVYGYAVMPKKG